MLDFFSDLIGRIKKETSSKFLVEVNYRSGEVDFFSLTKQFFRLADDLLSIKAGEDPFLSCPHVIASVPVVILFFLHIQRVIHVQLQLICMSGNEPAKRIKKKTFLNILVTIPYLPEFILI